MTPERLTPLLTGLTRRQGLIATAACLAASTGRSEPAPELPIAVAEGTDATAMGELLALLGQEAGLTWRVERVPFTRLQHLVRSGQCLALGLGKTAERARTLDFSQPLFSAGLWVVGTGAVPHTLQGLAGRQVCIPPGMHQDTLLADGPPAAFRLETVSGDLAQRLRMLKAGRCELLLVSHRNGHAQQLQQRVDEAGGAGLRLSRGPLLEQAVRLCVAKDSPWAAYLPRLDQAIHAQRARLQQLLDPHPA